MALPALSLYHLHRLHMQHPVKWFVLSINFLMHKMQPKITQLSLYRCAHNLHIKLSLVSYLDPEWPWADIQDSTSISTSTDKFYLCCTWLKFYAQWTSKSPNVTQNHQWLCQMIRHYMTPWQWFTITMYISYLTCVHERKWPRMVCYCVTSTSTIQKRAHLRQ